ncbi:MAG: DUF554 domain-containing protein, partial [Phaeodactylibacter sp.]|nr:DUF554 domain-containing protein [Phaeodactylibacter sp.]
MKLTLPIGTFINMAAVTVGSLIGLFVQQLLSPELEAIIFQAIGLATLVIGVSMSLKIPDGYLLLFIFSLIFGGVLGTLIGVDAGLQFLGDWLKNRLQLGNERFTEGLITAFLLFCVGSITFVGAIEEGLEGKRELLMIKSLLYGISSIAFAATYGIGVLVSIVPMLIFQGGLTLAAGRLQKVFTEVMIRQLSAVGGALIIGLGINLLGLGK